jgi:hypothetical protein
MSSGNTSQHPSIPIRLEYFEKPIHAVDPHIPLQLQKPLTRIPNRTQHSSTTASPKQSSTARDTSFDIWHNNSDRLAWDHESPNTTAIFNVDFSPVTCRSDRYEIPILTEGDSVADPFKGFK